MWITGALVALAAFSVMVVLTGCVSAKPGRVTAAERREAMRTEGLPLTAPVTVRWNDHGVPYVEAESDRDAAVALGVIHAHLRAGQIEVFRRIASGRLSETAGPFATEIDHALRLIDLKGSAAAAEAVLDPETRVWLEGFVEGLNAQQAVAKRPPEARLLNLKVEPWTVRDVLLVARLASADLSWLAYASALRAAGSPDFERRWAAYRGAGGAVVVGETGAAGELARLLAATGRHGSNSVALAPTRTVSGAAMVANDPHLGFALPNLWLLAGVRTPTQSVVGFMVAGVPVFGLGRNPDVAWGGTNMHSASSDLFDVTGLPEAAFEVGTTTIRRRFWTRAERPVRKTAWGPVVTDAKVLAAADGREFALRWVGQTGSDEVTAFRMAATARTVAEFEAAFATYAVAGQNMVAADTRGSIAKVLAVRVPARPADWYESGPFHRREEAVVWERTLGPAELRHVVNPPEGFVVSANNRPAPQEVPLGFSFSPEDRVERLAELVKAREKHDLESLGALQRDVTSAVSVRLAAGLVERLERDAEPGPRREAVAAALRGWDGSYPAEAVAPVVFEAMLGPLVRAVYGVPEGGALPFGADRWGLQQAELLPGLDALGASERRRAWAEALAAVERATGKFGTWGEMHRLRVQHLMGAVPVVGRSLRVEEVPAAGSRETLMKTDHGLVEDRHVSPYGSQARHVSDLSDPDANWFVLYGGQDGWLGSANFVDQLPLWRAGGWIRMPLRPEVVREEFRHAVVLR